MRIIYITLIKNLAKAREYVVDHLGEFVIDIENHDVQILKAEYDEEDPVRGCMRSHLRALCLLGDEEGLILEEDVKFTRQFNLGELWTSMKKTNDQILFLGYNAVAGMGKLGVNDRITLNRSYCAHAYLVANGRSLLNKVESYKFAAGELHAIDVAYQAVALPAPGVYPILALQRPGWSSIEKKEVDYTQTLIYRSVMAFGTLPPVKVQYIYLEDYPVETHFLLRRLPITKVLPNLDDGKTDVWGDVVIVVENGKDVDEDSRWLNYYEKYKLAALFRTRVFKVVMFNDNIWAMSREYYSTKSPFILVHPTAFDGIDYFYPLFGDSRGGKVFDRDINKDVDSELTTKWGEGGNTSSAIRWRGWKGLSTMPIVFLVAFSIEDERFMREILSPRFPCSLVLNVYNQVTLRLPQAHVTISLFELPIIAVPITRSTRMILLTNMERKDKIMMMRNYEIYKKQINIFPIDKFDANSHSHIDWNRVADHLNSFIGTAI